MPKLSGTNNVPVARSRYQTSTTPIPEGTDEPRQDYVLESKQLLPNTSTRQARHERSAILERVSSSVSVPITQSLKFSHLQPQQNMHELPDRPAPYQGPPALERRESNRSRHEVRWIRCLLRTTSQISSSVSLNNHRTVGSLTTYEQKPILKGVERDG